MSPASKGNVLAELQAVDLESDPDRAVDLALALVDSGDREGLWIVWNELWSRQEDFALRTIAFATVHAVERIGDDAWPVITSFLSSPSLKDSSAIINIVTALQLADSTTGLAVNVLQVDLFGFVVRCLDLDGPSAEAAGDLLIRLHDLGALQAVLVRDQVAELRKLTSQAQVLRSRRPLLAECFRSNDYKQTLAFDRHVIEKAADSIRGAEGKSQWAVAARTAAEAAKRSLADVVFSQKMRASAGNIDGMVQHLRLDGPETKTGRIGVEALRDILKGWHRLFETAYATAQAATGAKLLPPRIFALTPETGSFVVRLQVLHDSDETVAVDAFEDSARLVEGRGTLSNLEAQDDAAGAVALLHNVLSKEDLELTVDMTDSSVVVPGARARISKATTARILKSRKPTVSDAAEQEVLGVLQGANQTNGRVEIGALDGQATYQCVTPPSARGVLLNKVIGKTYMFSLRKEIATRELGEGAVKWTLLGIRPAHGAVAEDDGRRPRLPAPSVPVPSDDIPQQDSLDRIIQVVRLVDSGVAPSPEKMNMKHANSQERANTERHIGYMKQAARILGLITDNGLLTRAGETLMLLPSHERVTYLSMQFQASHIGRAWMAWAGVESIRDLDPESSREFLKQRGVTSSGKNKGDPLSESMLDRRGRTLNRWAREFGGERTDEASEE